MGRKNISATGTLNGYGAENSNAADQVFGLNGYAPEKCGLYCLFVHLFTLFWGERASFWAFLDPFGTIMYHRKLNGYGAEYVPEGLFSPSTLIVSPEPKMLQPAPNF